MSTTTISDLPEDRPVSRSAAQKSANPLNLTPEQAKREAGKLHELREDLETEKTSDETSARSSPIGRHDE